MIYGRSVKTTKVDVVRVNSKQRQKKDDKYFRELVADCIKLLEKNGKAICFDKDQLEEIKKDDERIKKEGNGNEKDN